MLNQTKDGSGTVLAVLTKERVPAFPDVPTAIEAGLPGMAKVDLGTWTNLFAPAGTPPEVLEQLNHAVNTGLATPEAQGRLKKLSLGNLATLSVAESRARWEQETVEWRPILEGLGLAKPAN
jgi:tripartite-type tricarboxylate transporter receptor subunit TctC